MTGGLPGNYGFTDADHVDGLALAAQAAVALVAAREVESLGVAVHDVAAEVVRTRKSP